LNDNIIKSYHSKVGALVKEIIQNRRFVTFHAFHEDYCRFWGLETTVQKYWQMGPPKF
jgi:hypothetical protein